MRTARAMAAADPEKAAKWSAALPMGKDPSDPYPGVRQTVEMWAKTAPEEMARWVESNRSSPCRDSAVAGIVNYYVRAGDSETARTWAQTVQSGTIRQSLPPTLWDPPQGQEP
ncbi:MAG: hypothetical protein JWM59_4907 [Verrucomicrobiales bacterium]|nr:hypothetical protein [Verrucomicrobiales bacterium]